MTQQDYALDHGTQVNYMKERLSPVCDFVNVESLVYYMFI